MPWIEWTFSYLWKTKLSFPAFANRQTVLRVTQSRIFFPWNDNNRIYVSYLPHSVNCIRLVHDWKLSLMQQCNSWIAKLLFMGNKFIRTPNVTELPLTKKYNFLVRRAWLPLKWLNLTGQLFVNTTFKHFLP